MRRDDSLSFAPQRLSPVKGFTLIELLAVLTILLILAGIVVWGTSSMINASHTKATRGILQSQENMFEEWRRSAKNSSLIPSQPLLEAGVPLDLAANEPGGDRDGLAVALTRAMNYRMMRVPRVKAMIDSLQSDRLIRISRAAGGGYSKGDGDQVSMLEEYTVSGAEYICCGNHEHDSATTPPRSGSSSGNYWLETSENAPIILDSWDNPCLFIPVGGFVAGDLLISSAGTFELPFPDDADRPIWLEERSYNAGDVVAHPTGSNWLLYQCTRNHSSSSTNAPDPTKTDPWAPLASRAFFASAGSDGIFYDPARPETLDDNVYSFER